jgi:hypothetical protein
MGDNQYYDADGEVVEGVLAPEAAKELQEKAEGLEEQAKKTEELETTLKEKEEELAKYSDKEFNFKKFRDAEEVKRKEMMEGFSEKEKQRITEIDSLHKRVDESDERYFGAAKDQAIKQLAGDDEEMKTKLEDAVKESVGFLGKPKDAGEVTARYQRAYELLTGTQKTVNPLNAFSPAGSQIQAKTGTSFVDTPNGKALIEEKFGKQLEQVKKKNPNFKL